MAAGDLGAGNGAEAVQMMAAADDLLRKQTVLAPELFEGSPSEGVVTDSISAPSPKSDVPYVGDEHRPPARKDQ
eukprot:gene30346-37919_t